MKYIWKMILAYGLLFVLILILAYGLLYLLIWLIWLMGIVDGQVIIEAAGNCTGNGSHMLTVENCNLSGNITNWTVTN